MIQIPMGKAIVPVETESDKCNGCCFWEQVKACDGSVACCSSERKDGKNVHFILVDYPAKEKK